MRVLLVGSDDDARRSLHVMLDRLGGEVAAVSDVEASRRWLAANRCDAVIAASDVVTTLDATCPRIALLRARDLATALSLLDGGVDHVISEPLDELAVALALRHVTSLPRAAVASPAPTTSLIGDGPAMQRLRHTIDVVAATRTTVLILGESGTGKELVARAIHETSPRAARRFVAVNCAAIPAALLESELFGHVRGAFTDAVRDKPGLFEDADGGTLFLDEIGEMPLALQSKLLRVLQESEIRRVGDTASIQVDVRLVAATLRDLDDDVAAGRFREDLFYRLNVVPIAIPPLRDRVEDIPQLARFFAARAAIRHARAVTLADSAVDALAGRAWAGNVRELENVIERVVVLADGPVIDADVLASVLSPRPADLALEVVPGDLSIKKATRTLEADLIRRALGATSGNRTNAAKLLEISHRALLYKMKEYGIS